MLRTDVLWFSVVIFLVACHQDPTAPTGTPEVMPNFTADTIDVGEELEAKAILVREMRKVEAEWSTSDSLVAKVNKTTGLIKGVGVGVAVITGKVIGWNIAVNMAVRVNLAPCTITDKVIGNYRVKRARIPIWVFFPTGEIHSTLMTEKDIDSEFSIDISPNGFAFFNGELAFVQQVDTLLNTSVGYVAWGGRHLSLSMRYTVRGDTLVSFLPDGVFGIGQGSAFHLFPWSLRFGSSGVKLTAQVFSGGFETYFLEFEKSGPLGCNPEILRYTAVPSEAIYERFTKTDLEKMLEGTIISR